MGCRKNLTRLTLAEKTAFVAAVNALRTSGRYDTYVQQHAGAGNHAHNGPAFFPWHREFLRRFELDLQAIDSSVTLPYWDWTVENLNSAGTASLIWADDLMGGPGNPGSGFVVTTGPFAAWGIRRNAFNIFQSPGGGGTINTIKNDPNYTGFTALEGPHGGAHIWVGGDMGAVSSAVRDPVFFLLHCNVDRLWAEWTVQHQGSPTWVQYAPTTGGPLGHNLNDTMWPWNGSSNPFTVAPWNVSPENIRPADLLDHRAIDTLYDTIDPECRPKLKERLPKEIIKERIPKEVIGKEIIKERFPKEVIGKEIIKERLPKELTPKETVKERLPKERLPKELAEKELIKDRGPKELKDIREVDPKPIREVDPKGIRETPGVFIPPELRPDLGGASLNFEPDVLEALEVLRARAAELRGDEL